MILTVKILFFYKHVIFYKFAVGLRNWENIFITLYHYMKKVYENYKEILSSSDTVRSLWVYRNLHFCLVQVGLFSYTNVIYIFFKGGEFKY